MQISTLNLALTRIGAGGQAAFSPLSLFANGEPGVWYDPSDLSTMFNLYTGGVPLTGVETSVGLILDKSKGLALGTENVANGNFAEFSSTGWTVGDEWTIFNGYARGTGAGLDTLLGYTFASSLAANKVFVVTFNISNINAGGFGAVELAGGVRHDISSNGNKTFYIFTTTAASSLIFTVGEGSEYDVTNISVKEVAGNHAFQSTDTRRPILSAKYNLLIRTEEFNNPSWTKPNTQAVNTIATTDPLGGLTADKFYPTSSGTNRFIYQTTGLTSGLYKWTIRAKQAEKSIIYIDLTGAGTTQAYFNLATGVKGSVPAGYSSTMTPLGDDGWYECAVTNNSPIAYSFLAVYGVADADGSSTVTASGTNGIYIWGASTVPLGQSNIPYQRVVTSGNYDADPTKFPRYLRFDGTDDFLIISSVPFQIDFNHFIAQGVSLTVGGSVDPFVITNENNSNNGGLIKLGFNGSSNFFYALRDNAGLPPYFLTAGLVASINTSYVQSVVKFGTTGTLRVNTSLSVTTAEIGTIGPTALNKASIGARITVGTPPGTPPFFTNQMNGRVFSLIAVRGEVSNTNRINTETYVAGKSGVTL